MTRPSPTRRSSDLLFDEIDAIAAARGDGNDVGEARRVLNSFLQFLDEDPGPSIVVATTNLPDILDRAVLRRFDLVLPYEMRSEEHTSELQSLMRIPYAAFCLKKKKKQVKKH